RVSSLGRVKSLEKVIAGNGRDYTVTEKILKTQVTNTGGYIVTLSKDSTRKTFTLKQLVSQAFTGNKTTFRASLDQSNNRISNLKIKNDNPLNSLTGKRITKDMLSELSLQDYIGEVVLITVDVVARQNHLNRMFNFDDLKSYLVIQAMEIVQKFDPEKCEDGWGTLGAYLHKCLNGRAINFKKKSFKDNERYATLEVKADDGDNFDDEHSETLLSEESGYSEVLGTDMMTVLSDELSPFQLDILKGRLEGKSDSEIGRALGVHSMKVYREMKKVQAIAIELGFLN
ncbi:sigma-70 family RNA polymerase sigma factor, partial [Bacillus cereus]|nr:sigma-70 family RNA polymerase sigma factor [Bacillus cereus]